jgi:hypothetical protein
LKLDATKKPDNNQKSWINWFIQSTLMPVLCPALSYKDLEIQEGGGASFGWVRMIESGNVVEREEIAESLLAYCGLDTLAMVELVKVLRT